MVLYMVPFWNISDQWTKVKLVLKENKWQGPALVARSGGSKNVTYRQQTTYREYENIGPSCCQYRRVAD